MTKSSPTPDRLWWIAVMAYRGIICHVQACISREAASETIADYLRAHHRYDGSSDLPVIAEWVSEHEPDIDVQIIEQTQSPMASEAVSSIDDTLTDGRFVVISIESGQASSREYSAWLYEGVLDFNSAFPVRFGRGPTVTNALNALADELRADTA